MAAACSLFPSANCWEAEETWSAAVATCSAPSLKPLATRLIGWVMDLLIK